MLRLSIFVLLFISFYVAHCQAIKIDSNGYIAYCPCMGRFGNQADQFLGTLGFAKALNRTLLLPAWVEYRPGLTQSVQVPFDTYFNVSQVQKCHKVLLMEDFMRDIAPGLWPPNQRTSFCIVPRAGEKNNSCNAKSGNPFESFWNTYNIDFVRSQFYAPLHFDVTSHVDMKIQWRRNYPATWPVLAFTGAPASFPVQSENKKFQNCLIWNDDILNKAKEFINTKIPKGPFIGIHLRNGYDWVHTCKHIQTSPNLFSAPQCLGYRNEHGNATMSMCLPSLSVIIRHIKRVVRNDKSILSVFVASDDNHMLNELEEALVRSKIAVLRQDPPVSPHLDLAILGKANYFIGNCISSFSAFVAREREIKGYPTFFWGFPIEKSSTVHEDL